MNDPFFLFLGILGLCIQILGYSTYLYDLFWKKTAHPHLFTWTIWSLLSVIGFSAQLSEGEILGTGSLFLSIVFCGTIAVEAFRQKKIVFTRFDWTLFFLALCAIPLWIITKTPVYSVVLISFIDGIMMLPSARKSWKNPFNEPFFEYFSTATAQILSLFLLDEITIITAFYICSLIFFNFCFGSYIVVRRKYILKKNL